MEPYYVDDLVTLYYGDCREVTAWLGADVLVTDPPYGRAWRHGDTRSIYGWASDRHGGIANDQDTGARDAALAMWGDRPAMVFADLLLPVVTGAKTTLIYDKGNTAGFTGAVAGFRRNVEAIYVAGKGWPSGLGGDSAVIRAGVSTAGNLGRTTGHPHTKPLGVMQLLIQHCPPGIIADPFAGSGSTLVAAKLLGRHAIGVELDERYCETAAKRLAQDVLDFGGVA